MDVPLAPPELDRDRRNDNPLPHNSQTNSCWRADSQYRVISSTTFTRQAAKQAAPTLRWCADQMNPQAFRRPLMVWRAATRAYAARTQGAFGNGALRTI
jgi:hypothetical protein